VHVERLHVPHPGNGFGRLRFDTIGMETNFPQVSSEMRFPFFAGPIFTRSFQGLHLQIAPALGFASVKQFSKREEN
jgi:hypothetical protein